MAKDILKAADVEAQAQQIEVIQVQNAMISFLLQSSRMVETVTDAEEDLPPDYGQIYGESRTQNINDSNS